MPHWCAEVRWVSGYLHLARGRSSFFFLNKECGLKKRETFRDQVSIQLSHVRNKDLQQITRLCDSCVSRSVGKTLRGL